MKAIASFPTERDVIAAAFGSNIEAYRQGFPARYGAEYRAHAVRLGVAFSQVARFMT